jgi:hypothetical protein
MPPTSYGSWQLNGGDVSRSRRVAVEPRPALIEIGAQTVEQATALVNFEIR